MNKIFDGKRYWLLDGAMGTMLQKSGLKLGERPDLLSITHPDVVERINRAYVEAGSDLICANTFGSNAKKLAGCGYTVEEVVAAGIGTAKRAAAGTAARVMLDVGPIGELLEPAGALKFEEAYEIYKEVVLAGWRAGADLVKFATMTDLYERCSSNQMRACRTRPPEGTASARRNFVMNWSASRRWEFRR